VESQVEDWLKASGASYVRELKPIGLGGEVVDFLVTKPFPLAIEVTWADPKSWRLKTRRILNQRINIARQYGRYTPVVAVVSRAYLADGQALSMWRELPFFDAVIDADSLPNLQELRQNLVLNPLTQKVLEQGKPKSDYITSIEKIPETWAESLSLEDFVRPEPYPVGTIAEGLRLRLFEFCQEENIEVVQAKQNTIIGERGIERKVSLENRFRLDSVFGNELSRQILQKAGGYFDNPDWTLSLTSEDPKYAFRLKSLIWNSPKGRRVVIRYFTVSHPHFRHKAREFLADAWILRSLIDDPVDQVILLLGTGDRESPDPHTVNVLEADGITVFPWDFAKPEPLFVQYLRSKQDNICLENLMS
jgi:hypothetical protein